MTRRDFYSLATVGLGSFIGLILAVPGVAYIASPLRKKGREESFETLTRLSQLKAGVPRRSPSSKSGTTRGSSIHASRWDRSG